jgi:rsbT antagonist protein RsbS
MLGNGRARRPPITQCLDPHHGAGNIARKRSSLTPIPILKLGQSLLVPIYADLSDEAALSLQERLLYRLQETGARGVVIDITVLDVVDSFLGRVLSDLSRMVSLMDGVTVLVGMRPQVAMTLVELGLELRGLLSALDLEQGLDLVARKLAERDALQTATRYAAEESSTETGLTLANIAGLGGGGGRGTSHGG